MKHFSRLVVISILLVAVAMLVAPVAAQEGGEGGVILEPNIGDDPATFNPLIGNDSASSNVYQWLYPSIIAVSDEIGVEEAPHKNGMALGWEFDETGTIMTITLREDLFWNDGTPVTSADYLWAVEAVRSGETSSPRTSAFATLADGTPSTGQITNVTAPDDYTVVVEFGRADCGALTTVNDITPVPAHIWSELYGTDYALMDEDPRRLPEVSFGPFKDVEFDPGQRVSLVADQAYTDAELGYVNPSEWVYLSVPDLTVAVERLLAGELTFMGIPLERQGEFRDNADFQTFEVSSPGYNYMGYNLADPSDPQPGVDEDGNAIDQGLHPVFGDVRVRVALAHAVDVGAMIDGLLDGNGLQISTHEIPTSWAQSGVPAYDFDPAVALEMLEEAGWVDHDNNVSTPLICQGCLYATEIDPDFEGSPLTFRLNTNVGNNARERIGAIIQEDLGQIGIDVQFQAIDFNVMIDEMLAQTFDAVIIGWTGLSLDPGFDVLDLFTAGGDIPGAGFGYTSYNNPEFEDLINQGLTVPGCDLDERAALYAEAQTILRDEQPYLFLYVANSMTAVQANVEGFNPKPFDPDWNLDAWAVVFED